MRYRYLAVSDTVDRDNPVQLVASSVYIGWKPFGCCSNGRFLSSDLPHK